MFFLFTWIMGFFEWTPFTANPVDLFLQGIIGACGVSVLYNLMRIYNVIQTCSDSDIDGECKQNLSSTVNPLRANWRASVQFWLLTVLLTLAGSRVCSLIVLEFSLRAVSTSMSSRLDADGRSVGLHLILCQFSLGCSLTCTLSFLHQGAPHSSLSLLLAAALSWALAGYCSSVLSHVVRLFPVHKTERCCGRCISLLTSGHKILGSLEKVVVLAFAVATMASAATVYDNFLSQKDAMKFWTLLTLCYVMLVVYSTQDGSPCAESILHTVVLRLGGLLVLMLAVGHWSDVLHIIFAFLGEAVCLLSSQDLLKAVLKEELEISRADDKRSSTRNVSSDNK